MTGTNANRDPEFVLAEWLDEGPTDLPDATRRAILTALPTTPQARRGVLAPWRSTQMTTFARWGAVLVAAIVAVGVAALFIVPRTNVGGPGPSSVPGSASPSASSAPDAEASAPPLPTLGATFVSPSYGYEIRYPAGWAVTPGHGPWPFGATLEPGHPVTDSIVTPAALHRMRISVASLALPNGTTMDDFRAFASPYSAPFQPDPCPSLAPLPEPVMIDVEGNGASPEKVAAVVSINGCDALAELGGHVYDVEVIAGGRGYEFILDGELTPADALAWLASIKLEPATARAPSATPGTSASSAAPRPSASS